MKKLLLLAATVISATAVAPRAQAGLSFAISIGPRYTPPPPVYVAPPVYRPVYNAPAPVCVAPATVVVAPPVCGSPRAIVVAPPVYIAPPAPRVVYYGQGYHGYHGRWGHYRHGYHGRGY